MFSTRSSLPAGAVVASWNKWRESRSCGATDSSTCRSMPGRHVLVMTIGIANSGRNTSAGLTVTSRSSVTTRRASQPTVENSDMKRWSSANTWSRSTASRSRYSGRSWCSIVATDACSVATCASSATEILSRKRRCMRVNTTRRNHVAVADNAMPSAAHITSVRSTVVAAQPVGEELQPQCDQCVGQRGEHRHREREQQAARLGAVAELHRAPERRQGGGQVVSRACHARPPPRARRARPRRSRPH